MSAPTARIAVDIHPIGIRGQANISIRDLGPDYLTKAEIVKTLELALEIVRSNDWEHE